jgi:HSP20 family protein
MLVRTAFPLAPSQVLDTWHHVNRVFDQAFGVANGASKNGSNGRVWLPAVDVTESESALTLELELPGVKSEDIKIDLVDKQLTITGERKLENGSRTFSRSFTLPPVVNPEKIEAKVENGILRVVLPKAEKALPRSIPIR